MSDLKSKILASVLDRGLAGAKVKRHFIYLTAILIYMGVVLYFW
jgi:hypothetical protein